MWLLPEVMIRSATACTLCQEYGCHASRCARIHTVPRILVSETRHVLSVGPVMTAGNLHLSPHVIGILACGGCGQNYTSERCQFAAATFNMEHTPTLSYTHIIEGLLIMGNVFFNSRYPKPYTLNHFALGWQMDSFFNVTPAVPCCPMLEFPFLTLFGVYLKIRDYCIVGSILRPPVSRNP